ncbi:MAG: hypothetical protein ACTSSP_08925 [Candidatus Asgardarchaeia archaeon]
MQKTLKSLEKSKVVKNYIIIDARIGVLFLDVLDVIEKIIAKREK